MKKPDQYEWSKMSRQERDAWAKEAASPVQNGKLAAAMSAAFWERDLQDVVCVRGDRRVLRIAITEFTTLPGIQRQLARFSQPRYAYVSKASLAQLMLLVIDYQRTRKALRKSANNSDNGTSATS